MTEDGNVSAAEGVRSLMGRGSCTEFLFLLGKCQFIFTKALTLGKERKF